MVQLTHAYKARPAAGTGAKETESHPPAQAPLPAGAPTRGAAAAGWPQAGRCLGRPGAPPAPLRTPRAARRCTGRREEGREHVQLNRCPGRPGAPRAPPRIPRAARRCGARMEGGCEEDGEVGFINHQCLMHRLAVNTALRLVGQVRVTSEQTKACYPPPHTHHLHTCTCRPRARCGSRLSSSRAARSRHPATTFGPPQSPAAAMEECDSGDHQSAAWGRQGRPVL